MSNKSFRVLSGRLQKYGLSHTLSDRVGRKGHQQATNIIVLYIDNLFLFIIVQYRGRETVNAQASLQEDHTGLKALVIATLYNKTRFVILSKKDMGSHPNSF